MLCSDIQIKAEQTRVRFNWKWFLISPEKQLWLSISIRQINIPAISAAFDLRIETQFKLGSN